MLEEGFDLRGVIGKGRLGTITGKMSLLSDTCPGQAT